MRLSSELWCRFAAANVPIMEISVERWHAQLGAGTRAAPNTTVAYDSVHGLRKNELGAVFDDSPEEVATLARLFEEKSRSPKKCIESLGIATHPDIIGYVGDDGRVTSELPHDVACDVIYRGDATTQNKRLPEFSKPPPRQPPADVEIPSLNLGEKDAARADFPPSPAAQSGASVFGSVDEAAALNEDPDYRPSLGTGHDVAAEFFVSGAKAAPHDCGSDYSPEPSDMDDDHLRAPLVALDAGGLVFDVPAAFENKDDVLLGPAPSDAAGDVGDDGPGSVPPPSVHPSGSLSGEDMRIFHDLFDLPVPGEATPVVCNIPFYP